MKLICLPYAGGNKYSFRGLKPFLDSNIDFVTLELPGRGARICEPLTSDLEKLTDDLYKQIQPYLMDDYMLYGHSMGGMLGNLLIHQLNENKRSLPLHFLVTGCAAPGKRHRNNLHHLPDSDFQKELKEMGGIPDEVAATKELMEYILPIVRSDIKAIETHKYTHRGRYNVPITVISGTEEKIGVGQILAWNEETCSGMNHFCLSGDHFFIHQHYNSIGNIINQQSAKCLDLFSI